MDGAQLFFVSIFIGIILGAGIVVGITKPELVKGTKIKANVISEKQFILDKSTYKCTKTNELTEEGKL